MIATTYNFIEKHNQLLGFDGRFRLRQADSRKFSGAGHDFAPLLLRAGSRARTSIAQETPSPTLLATMCRDETSAGTTTGAASPKITAPTLASLAAPTTTVTASSSTTTLTRSRRRRSSESTFTSCPKFNFDWQGRIQSWGHETQTELTFKNQTYARSRRQL